jgi:hypothetical protein
VKWQGDRGKGRGQKERRKGDVGIREGEMGKEGK